jgi:hypothetical protein
VLAFGLQVEAVLPPAGLAAYGDPMQQTLLLLLLVLVWLLALLCSR